MKLHGEKTAWLTVGALSLAYLWPLWGVEFPLMQDLAGHIEAGFQLAMLREGAEPWAGWLTVKPQPWPNSLGIWLLSLVGRAVGWLEGTKVLLSLFLMAWPLSVAFFARAIGRSAWLALLAMPAALDYTWNLGFYNFLIARPLLFLALGLAVGWSREGTPMRAGGLIAALCVAFLGHGIVFGYAMLGATLAIVVCGEGRARWLRLWPVAAAAPIAVPYLLAQRGSGGGPLTWHGPAHAFAHAWEHLGQLSPAPWEEMSFLLAGAAGLTLLVLGLRQRSPDARAGTRLLLVLLAAFLAVHVFGPLHLPNVAIVCIRGGATIWALLALLPVVTPGLVEGIFSPGRARECDLAHPGESVRPWRHTHAALAAVAVAAVLIHAGGVRHEYARFNVTDMTGFRDLLRSVPEGRRLASHYVSSGSAFSSMRAAWHWPKLYAVDRGGLTDDSFAWTPTSFVTLTEAGRRSGWAQRTALSRQRLRGWDYLIVRSDNGIDARVAGWAERVGQAGTWQLYRLRGAARRDSAWRGSR